jgi:hypothetical protein
MKPGQVFYLSNPDETSRKHLIGKGHGFFWVWAGKSWHYQSVATGKEFMLYPSEITLVEQDDGDLC